MKEKHINQMRPAEQPGRLHTLLCIPSVILLLCSASPAFPQLEVGAELRPRVMIDNGYKTFRPPDSQARVYVTQRTRMSFRLTGADYETYIAIQDVRYWGGDDNFSSSGIFGDTRSVSLHQGWFMLKPAPWLSLKVGRQLLAYDDQRIIASRSWNDFQVTYDAVVARVQGNGHRADLGLSWNAESATETTLPRQKFRTFDFIRYERTMDAFKWSAIGLVTGNRVSEDSGLTWHRGTVGMNMEYSPSGIQTRASFYYQHHLNEVGGRVTSWCGSLSAGTDIIPGKLNWSAGIDYLSGQDEFNGDADYQATNHAFDLLYGRRHAWYGYMDYFSNMPAQGLQDYMLKAACNPADRVSLQADWHYFRLAARMEDPEAPGESLDKSLGNELDLTLLWNLRTDAVLQAGYSFLLATTALEALKGMAGEEVKFARFAYLMITVTPKFTFGRTEDQP